VRARLLPARQRSAVALGRLTSAGWEQVVARRLERSSLLARADDAVAVARATGGVHAQVQASAELQLVARVDGLVRDDVRAALWERRTLVKAWTLRGTLHLHPAGELALWHAARHAAAGDSDEGMPPWRDPAGTLHPGLSADEVAETRSVVLDVLDGRCLLREELAAEVVRRVGPGPRERLRSGFAFFTADLCHGPPQGARVTFARPDQWIEGWREVDGEEALREACRRFLYAYGPARPAAFLEWLGAGRLRVGDATALYAAVGVEEVEVDGRRAFVLAGDTAFTAAPSSLRLLPEYDVYVMGSRERDRLVPDAVRAQIAAHGKGRYEGPAGVRFLFVDGVAAGLWERAKRGKRIELRVTPARRLDRAHRAELAREAERIGAFLGLEPALTA
jgi:hypothetical protein